MQILLANAKIMNDHSDVMPLTTPMFQTVANDLAAEMAMCDIDTLGKILSRSNGALHSINLINSTIMLQQKKSLITSQAPWVFDKSL